MWVCVCVYVCIYIHTERLQGSCCGIQVLHYVYINMHITMYF